MINVDTMNDELEFVPQDLSLDDMVSICCREGDIRFMLRVPKRVADRYGKSVPRLLV